MVAEPEIDVEDVQGNIVPGFKKDHQTFLFLKIADVGPAKAFLARIAPRVISLRQMGALHMVWKDMRRALGREPTDLQMILLNVAISHPGLTKLGFGADLDTFDDEGFSLGLPARSGMLGDPTVAGDPGAAPSWQFGVGDAEADILLIMASDDSDWLGDEVTSIEQDAHQSGLETIHIDRGQVRPGDQAGHEVFGFKDGVSEPAIRGVYPRTKNYVIPRSIPPGTQYDGLRERFASPGRSLIWPGHVLFGYQQQDKDEPTKPEAAREAPAWAKNGSFLVYRRLRQDDAAFNAFTSAVAAQLAPLDAAATPDWVGSRMVGRWKDGTPIMRQPGPVGTIGAPGDNYFTFEEATTLALPGDPAPLNAGDDTGAICPLAAHIRKINPRDDTTDLGGSERSLQRLILRRGIAFDNSAAIAGDKGLLFVSYQSSIVDQFEFLMTNWVNRSDHPRGAAGFDPILGATSGRFMNVELAGQTRQIDFTGRFIIPTGGGYFFAPSRSFLASLAAH